MSDTLSYKGYIAKINTSIEDNCLYGKIEFINDLVMFDGETIAELRAEFEKAVDQYLQMCKENNLEPDQPFKGSFNIRIGSDLHKKLSLEAAKDSRSLNELIKDVLSKHVNRPKPTAPMHALLRYHYSQSFESSTVADVRSDIEQLFSALAPSQTGAFSAEAEIKRPPFRMSGAITTH